MAKLTRREQALQNNKWDKIAAFQGGMGRAPRNQVEVPKERIIVNHSDPNELEGAVLAEVGEVLAKHPSVIFAVRQNTGAAPMAGRGGEVYPVWFYRWIRMRHRMTITDYWGFMFSEGNPVRMMVPFALECKRRDWKFTGRVDREELQREFIETIIDCGGRGGFVTSAEQALAILK